MRDSVECVVCDVMIFSVETHTHTRRHAHMWSANRHGCVMWVCMCVSCNSEVHLVMRGNGRVCALKVYMHAVCFIAVVRHDMVG